MKTKDKILIGAILILVVFLSALVLRTVGYVVENQTPDQSWLSENCGCLERERFKCGEGWEVDLENRLCRRDKQITNVLLGCSKYNCSGEIYKLSN